MVTGLSPHKEISWMTFVNQHMGDLPANENDQLPTVDYDKEKLKEEALAFMHAIAEFERLDSSDCSVTSVGSLSLDKLMKPNLKQVEMVHNEDASVHLETGKQEKLKIEKNQTTMNGKISNLSDQDQGFAGKKKSRLENLDYFHHKTLIFDNLQQERDKIVRRSRRNLKQIQQHYSKQTNTGDSNSVAYRQSTDEFMAEKISTQNYLSEDDDFCKSKSRSSSEAKFSDFTASETMSHSTFLSEAERKSVFKKPPKYNQHASESYHSTKPQPLQVSTETLRQEHRGRNDYEGKCARNSLKVDLELFKRKIDNISDLTKRLLHCLRTMTYDQTLNDFDRTKL